MRILSMLALVKFLIAALATSASANSVLSDVQTSAIDRSLQTVTSYEQSQIPRTPWCKPGFVDKTQGKAMFWRCGNSCPGSYGGWTDGCCECACIPENAPPTVCSNPIVAVPGLPSGNSGTPQPTSQPGQPQAVQVPQAITRTLAGDHEAGVSTLRLSHVNELAAGHSLRIESGGNQETKKIVAVNPDPQRRLASRRLQLVTGTVDLDSPLQNSYPHGAPIQHFPQVVRSINGNNGNNAGNDAGFLQIKTKPEGGDASIAGRGSGSSDDDSGMSQVFVVLIVCAALCIVMMFFGILVMYFGGCPSWCTWFTKKKLSRVSPTTDAVVVQASPRHGSWNLENAYPQGYKIDMKKINGDQRSSCDTGSTRSPIPSPRDMNASPRSMITQNDDVQSWRSPRTSPRPSPGASPRRLPEKEMGSHFIQKEISVKSNEQPAIQSQLSTASRSGQPMIQKQISSSSRSGQPTIQAQISTSSRRGSGGLLTPNEVHSSSVRSQSASPRAVHAGQLDSQENRRARSSSPGPSSLRSAANANEQILAQGPSDYISYPEVHR